MGKDQLMGNDDAKWDFGKEWIRVIRCSDKDNKDYFEEAKSFSLGEGIRCCKKICI